MTTKASLVKLKQTAKRCEHCIYLHDFAREIPGYREVYASQEYYICTRFPPVPVSEERGPPSTMFPKVNLYNFCGEFKEKK